MSGPKHLWAGDWEDESAANRRAEAAAPVAEPPAESGRPADEPRRAAEPAPRPAPRREPARARPPRPGGPRPFLTRDRRAALVLIGALLAVAVAVALTTSGNGSPEGTGRPYLGVSMSGTAVGGSGGLSPSAVGGGATVDTVDAGGPAAAAGVQTGDIIASMDGQFVSSASDVQRIVAAHHPGDEIAVGLQRGDQKLETKVTLGDRPAGQSP